MSCLQPARTWFSRPQQRPCSTAGLKCNGEAQPARANQSPAVQMAIWGGRSARSRRKDSAWPEQSCIRPPLPTHTHICVHTHTCAITCMYARTHTHTHTHNVQPRDSVMGTSPALLMYLMDLFRAVSCSSFFLSTKVKTLYLPAPHLCLLVVAVWLLSCV